jgi:transcriptional regulator with XRE-family HTH domain
MLATSPTDWGRLVRDRRRGLGLTQAELAHRVGVSRQWVNAFERGSPRAELVLVLRTLEQLDLVSDVVLANGVREPTAVDLLDLDRHLDGFRQPTDDDVTT